MNRATYSCRMLAASIGAREKREARRMEFKPIYDEATGEKRLAVALAGRMLLDTPLLNKGSAFTESERREFELLGLLPPHLSTIEEQLIRNYENYKRKENDLERY